MGATNVPGLIGLGLVAGFFGGMFGIGGGLIMVPGLILIIGLGQKEATGTSLFAQLLPVGLLGVKEFWQRGEVNLGAGLAMAVGLFVGAWLGGMLVGSIPPQRMKQAYGAFLLCVGLYFLLAPSGVSREPAAAPVGNPAASAPATESEG